jgi:hypothetical protein
MVFISPMSSHPTRKWRRTIVTQRDGTVVPLSDNWSLIDLETDVAVAQLYKDTGYQDRPAWRVICRSMNEDGELKDVMMTWIEDPTKAREYAEGQTNGMRYVIRRKRTKEEILGRKPKW